MIVGVAQRSSDQSGKRKQNQSAAAARAVAAARGSGTDRSKVIIGVVFVLVIAAAVLGGVFYQQHRASVAAREIIPALTVPGANYPVVFDRATATVTAGKPDAKATIDAYEDLLCPICGVFEATDFDNIEKQLVAGKIKVRYHLVNLLDANSRPTGYSMMAANTALAVAAVAPDKFMDFHYSLFHKQPEENGPGWTQDQLVSLANRLGVSGQEFTDLVNNKAFDARIQQNLTNATNDHSLWQQGQQGSGFGTPTIVYNGQLIKWQQDGWLDAIVNGG